jgi:hypothetical protein
MIYRLSIIAALAVALAASPSDARGSHGGSHSSSHGTSHGGGHHGLGTHYSRGYVTKKGTYVSGGYRHYPRKKKP